VQGRQVHGADVRRVRELPGPTGEPLAADGQATWLPAVAALVLTADCLPVALIAPEAVAIVHAGWRGLAAGVLAEGVAAVRELAGDGAIHAAIGPGAGPCCYEVGDEERAAFAAHGDEVVAGRNLDLKAVARRELEAAGAVAVHDAEQCTICGDPALWFSHRRDRGVTGRQAGVAWRA
jgi:YfiH family protein